MSDSRIGFSPDTKRLLADRAGYRCSLPGCGRLTIGPGADEDSRRSIGVACHIYSAAPGGPRGQNGLSEDQLASVENGIWLCSDHAALIDKGNGVDYPAAKLQAYKGLQEAKAARELNGLGYPVHWIEQLTIQSNPLFAPGSVVRFGKVTVIAGSNMVGKSALCDWLAGFGNQQSLWRWLPCNGRVTELDLELDYHQPEQVRVRMHIPASGQLGFSVDGQPGPVQPMRLNFVHLHEEWSREDGQAADDLALLCRFLEVDPLHLPNLFPLIDSDGLGYARNLKFDTVNDDDEKGGRAKTRKVLHADVRGTAKGLPFRGLSHGEQQYVLIELAVALARYTARFAPTMLLLDGGMHRFGDERLEAILTALADRKIQFQTVIVLPRGPEESVPPGAGWTVVRFHQDDGQKTTVQQA